MNNYNPFYAAFNGGYQHFDGYQYSNITSAIPLPAAEEAPPQEPFSSFPSKTLSRPARTLTTIKTDSPNTALSNKRIKKAEKSGKGEISGKSLKRGQEPAFRFAPYTSALAADELAVATTWKRNPNDFNLLVVPSSDEIKTSAVAINLRKPSEVPAGSGGGPLGVASAGIPYAYPAAGPSNSLEIHAYASTMSNRMGVTGPRALARQQNPQAHSQGIGNYLLRKMGWQPGAAIGVRTHGATEPLSDQLELKLNKKGLGLGAVGDVGPSGVLTRSMTSVTLPVAYLNDICLDQGWKFPVYQLEEESGPPHAKVFKFKIFFNGGEYRGEEGGTKKLAKANAARKCLQELKLVI